jgi:mRNA-degrading endonuclease RelE of RelBE toxin-antitoxin system
LELESFGIDGLSDIYLISNVRKEFKKAVDEVWPKEPPWKRYQQKLIGDLTVLQDEKENAIDLESFEKITGEDDLYSIRHPEAKKNVRVLYTITDDKEVVLLTAFLENNSSDYKLAIDRAKKRLRWLNSD